MRVLPRCTRVLPRCSRTAAPARHSNERGTDAHKKHTRAQKAHTRTKSTHAHKKHRGRAQGTDCPSSCYWPSTRKMREVELRVEDYVYVLPQGDVVTMGYCTMGYCNVLELPPNSPPLGRRSASRCGRTGAALQCQSTGRPPTHSHTPHSHTTQPHHTPHSHATRHTGTPHTTQAATYHTTKAPC
jgi:hypothetical protein